MSCVAHPQRGSNPVSRIAAELAPFRQGQFDALCGVYCTLNALQIASQPIRPMSPSRAQALFMTAVAWLRRHHRQRNPVNHGMSTEMMLELGYNLARWASGPRARFTMEYCNIFAAKEWIGRSLHQGLPVVACLREEAHFSVITNVTSVGLMLFDSQGRGSLAKAKGESWTELLDLDSVFCIRAKARSAGDSSHGTPNLS